MLNITATLGPATENTDVIVALSKVCNRFRLNASHLKPSALSAWLKKLEQLPDSRRPPVVVDLQGAKMRIGEYPVTQNIPKDITLKLSQHSLDQAIIPVPHATFFEAIRPGDTITLNDAKVWVEILDRDESQASARVLRNGPLSSFKGINRKEHPIPYHEVLPADREAIEASLAFDFVEYAFSFALDGSEAPLLRKFTKKRRLTAKIERPEAMPNLVTIDRAFDELWLCRGDLGAQAGLKNLAQLQTEFAALIPSLKHPAYLAGQVLEHMTHFPEPTRSEVVHLHDIEKSGFTGIVLSDETAIGKNPLAVGALLAELCGIN